MPTSLLCARVYGRSRAARYIAGFAGAITVQSTFTHAMQRRIGPEEPSLADLLTQSRGLCGAVLAGLVATGTHDRSGPAGWLGFLANILGATMLDWLDGPLARRAGPTRLGAVLDIETDSWLTLWSAASAVRWGGLPAWCLLAPILHYAHPTLHFLKGELPAGGGPWWSRLTGITQMTLFGLALLPYRRPMRLERAAVVISSVQAAVVLLLLRYRRYT